MSYESFRQEYKPETDINILLLGQTGIGKTTFINAFINYLTYKTLDEALENELKLLIPASFILTDTVRDKTFEVKVGDDDDNERIESQGESCTQSCRSYVFHFRNCRLRIIDGPGVGDTRGVDYEQRNTENILTYISQYEHLNGICFFLHPAQNRLNIYFRYCVKEILRHLHRSAKDNIMFIFTNSRTTFYRPGDTTPNLRVLFRELKERTDVEVPFNQSNTFMFDNEGFRFLAAYRKRVRFIMDDKPMYEVSWEKSVIQIKRLVEKILQCDLHAVQDTCSLNEAQQMLCQLARPIAEVTRLIKENIALAAEYKRKILDSQEKNWNNQLPQKVGEFVRLNKRLTVCISPGCTRLIEVNGETIVDYYQKCHVGCSLKTVVQECIGHPRIQRCRAIRKRSEPAGFCRHCRCNWRKHMHITYQFNRQLKNISLPSRENICHPTAIMVLIDQRILALRNEEKQIRDIYVKLAIFIKENSIASFNDDLIEYYRHFLEEEKQKQGTNSFNRELVRGLEEAIEAYRRDLELYSKSIQSAASSDVFVAPEKIEEIFNLVSKLYELPINGHFIRNQMNHIKEAQRRDVENNEKHIYLYNEGYSSQVLSDLETLFSHEHR